MKHMIRTSAVVLLAVAFSVLAAPTAMASRVDQSNSLTQCITKADIIIIGFVEAKDDSGAAGVATVRVLRTLKGTLESKKLRIVDTSFRSEFHGSPEGPIVVKPSEGYIFFLRTSATGDPQLFDHYDGVINSSGPVVREIEEQVQQRK